MGAGGTQSSSRRSLPAPSCPSAPPAIEIKVIGRARFPDGTMIEIESVSIEEAYDGLWQAICREAGKDIANDAVAYDAETNAPR